MLYFASGICLFIVVAASRQGWNAWTHLLYWLLMALTGVVEQFVPSIVYFLPLLLLPGLRGLIRSWLVQNQSPRDLYGSLIVGVSVGAICLLTKWDLYVLALFICLEAFLIIRNLHSVFRSKGISVTQHPGLRVILILILLGVNISMFLMMLPWTATMTGGLFHLHYLAVSLLGMALYAGKTDAFKAIISYRKYAKSSLDEKEKFRILTSIDEQISEHGFHLDPNASLNALAKKVNANIHQVSQVINENKQMSFFELMAHHRIREAKKLLGDPGHQHIKIEQIGEEVGYLSKSAFNTSFKKITGFTPSGYRSRNVRDHKVERLPDEKSTGLGTDESTFVYLNNWMIMLSGFLKIYLRNQLRNKAFFVINMAGLVIGIASSILIYVYLRHELSYDRFHQGAENIYRATWITGNPQTRTPHPMAQALVKDFPQVEAAVSLTPVYGPGLTLQSIYIRNAENNLMFREPDVFLADSTFFDVFDFELIVGDKKEVLDDVGDIVITERLAKKYFGDQNPYGKSLEIPEYDFRGVVTGVMRTPPSNSHFHPQLIVSYITRKSREPDNFWWQWGDFGHFNYLRLRPGSDPQEVVDAIPDWLTKYTAITPEQIEDMKSGLFYIDLQPITDIHLRSGLRWELEANSNIVYVYILAAAIFFLVTIASINFINLSTARAFERSKEVGIRRTLGAQRSGISLQFIAESVTSCYVALLVGYLFAFLFFNQFTHLIGKELPVADLLAPSVVLVSLVITTLIGLITGLFPASYVIRVKPVDVLKGKLINQSQGGTVRKGLIAFQFIISCVMIFGSLMILRQIRYMQEKELGFTEDQTIVVELHNDEEISRLSAMKSEIGNIPGVIGSGGISNLPGGQFNQNEIYLLDERTNEVSCSELRVDFDVLPLIGLELSEGRWFDRSVGLDSTGMNFIVNKAAFEALQAYVDDPLDTRVVWNEEAAPRVGNIVGVINDFHYKSLHRSIQPMVININPGAINYLLVRIEAGANISTIVTGIENVHRQFDEDFDLDYYFLNQLIEDQYQAEKKAFDVFNQFTILALLLAAMGLLGLAYLVVTQRTREIGIRKVMGARVIDILLMENRAFLKIIGVAVLIGLPIAFVVMQLWLDAFAYRVGFNIMPFVITVIILVAVSVVSISLAVMRTILRNPSVALRYE